MKNIRFFTALLGFITLFSASVHAADPVEGYWLTQNERSVINIKACDEGLCGTIYWIIDGGMQYDTENPDPTMHETPLCGMKILWGFEKEADGEWENGNIYKADEGDTYSADMEIQDDGTLRLRGYLGVPMFGKTQVWNKISAKDYRKCSRP